jgi:hypothetical protein
MKRTHRLLAPAVLIAAALVALTLAASAAAEVRVGEAGRAADPSVPAEADVVHASASYDSATGAMSFILTTLGEPQAEDAEGEPSEVQMLVGFVTATQACSEEVLLSGEYAFPAVQILAPYAEPENAKIQTAAGPKPPFIENGPATRTVAGTTITLSGTVTALANQSFDCAVATVLPSSHEEPLYLIFPIAVPSPPAPPAEPPKTPEPAQSAKAPVASAPAPAPAVLSIARSKPLKLKPGKWTPVKVTVTNSGGTSSDPGSLRVKGAKGVTVKPETQRVPLLTPGGSWTLTAKVRLTEGAKAKSTLALIATAGSLLAKGSLVIKTAKPAG